MSLGVSGIIFSNADVPGCVGEPTDDNFIQEYQAGVFYPFFRAHANISNLLNREPWLRSERVQKVIRNAIHQRYA
jgi:alpha 1,3-glucosidase